MTIMKVSAVTPKTVIQAMSGEDPSAESAEGPADSRRRGPSRFCFAPGSQRVAGCGLSEAWE
jgi:hypothetical protein